MFSVSRRLALRSTTRRLRRHLAFVAGIILISLSAPLARGAVSFTGDVGFGSTTTIGNIGVGTLRIDGGSSFTSTGAILGGQPMGVGTLIVTGAASQFSFQSSGQMDVGSAGVGRVEVREGGVVSLGTGQMRVAVSSTSHGTVNVEGPGSLLNLGSQLLIGVSSASGSSNLNVSNGGIVNVQGQVQISLQGRVDLDGGLLRTSQLTNSGTIIGAGEIQAQSTANQLSSGRIQVGLGDLLRFTGPGDTIVNQGVIAVDGGQIDFTRIVSNTVAGSSTGEITLRNGVIRSGLASSQTQFLNSAVLASIGGTNDVYGRLTNQGAGQIAATNNSVLIFHDDVLANGGTITVFPGSSAIFLEDLAVNEDAVLLANLAGTDDDTGFGTIEVVGDANLAGSVDINLSGNFAPAAGNTFTLLAASRVAGELALGDAPTLPATLAWDVDTDAHQVVLSVVPSLAGDFNANGTVDGADYAVWRDTNGLSGHGLVADGNDDGTVDVADYDVWKGNFGATLAAAASGAIAVPEPHCFVSLIVAFVGLSQGQRRGGRPPRMLQ